MAKGKNKQVFNLAVVVALLFVLIIILIQRGFISTQEQRIRAASATGVASIACQLRDGRVFSVPTRFTLIENGPGGEPGRYVVEPGLTSPPADISESIDILTGDFNIRDIDFSQVPLRSLSGATVSGSELGILQIIEGVLYHQLNNIGRRADRVFEELVGIYNDQSRGPGSVAFQTTEAYLLSLEDQEQKLFDNFIKVQNWQGVGPEIISCKDVGLGDLPPPGGVQQQIIPQTGTGGDATTEDGTGGTTEDTTDDGATGGYCGDGICDSNLGEDSFSCSLDCQSSSDPGPSGPSPGF